MKMRENGAFKPPTELKDPGRQILELNIRIPVSLCYSLIQQILYVNP